jgi:hypothetical protein
MRTIGAPPILLFLLAPTLAQAQSSAPPDPRADSAFAAMQQRGAMVMGVDQTASEHFFEDRASGGRILFRMRDTTDVTGAATIRQHLRSIADSFAAGSFRDPASVHGVIVPGTETMGRLRNRIQYLMSEAAGGGELAISSTDSAAVAAIHEFLAFQRLDHRAAGHEHSHQH